MRQDKSKWPDGSVRDDYFVRETKRVAFAFALTEQGKVILENQYKHGAGAILKELPAGMVGKNETPLAAIKRELFEETGYAARKIKLIGRFHGDPSGSNTKIWCYLATECRKAGEPQDNPSEIIDLEFVTPRQLKKLVAQGKINGQGALAAVFLGLLALDKL
ncbi:NUDIX hydrolase [Candidatus Berkelbacteria bacterium]|nr:NUDIX hydrolase [Candidatus Berkelbacteria bacterium]